MAVFLELFGTGGQRQQRILEKPFFQIHWQDGMAGFQFLPMGPYTGQEVPYLFLSLIHI